MKVKLFEYFDVFHGHTVGCMCVLFPAAEAITIVYLCSEQLGRNTSIDRFDLLVNI